MWCPSWLKVALGAVALLVSPGVVFAQFGMRQPVSPGYRGRDPCPERCSISGPNPTNWSVYHNLHQIESCSQTVFYEFSLYDGVDNPDTLHRIYACTSYGPDWANLPNTTIDAVPAQQVNATYEIGWFADGTLAASDIRTLAKQIRQYLANGYAAANKSAIVFAQSGKASVGIYIGKGLQNEGTGSFALKTFQDNIPFLDVNTGSLAIQLCQTGDDSDHIFGLMATSNATFTPVQDALKSWSNAECMSFNGTKKVTGATFFTTPPSAVSTNGTNSTSIIGIKRSWVKRISPRADCTTVQVASGDSCGSLATKCGISSANFNKYNPAKNICATLTPLQHVCCSAGTLPDFSPKPNSDGSCATYTVQNNDNCAGIAAANSITIDQLGKFNDNTWAWNGCSDLWVGTIICLSSGSPPMPAPLANALCGPQVPGTKAPPSGTNITMLNPCPLNACCDVWGQCGITSDFCTNTGTGAPGTAKQGTNGCISNCGTNIVSSEPPAVFRSVAYFEGFGLGRPCLYQDALQLDASKYTNLHFAFATLTPDYQVKVGDSLSTYEFENFKRLQGPAKILSFGGWAFSTDPSTYSIFRQGVTAANRLTMATNIANFIIKNELDGVDIDWEYPGAPDIPGIPAGSKDDGKNYLAFLKVLKNLLPGKSVSIAAPASYWYLKGFPIAEMSKVVDYIIFMTYDLHGQWDAGNQYSQIGCPTGNCLRSDVNVTETVTALAMITKAGVPSNQVVVGVTSYGRSFAMADAGCYTEQCFFTGTAAQSNAAEGPCTSTAGYISDAEIKDIINSGHVNKNYLDGPSHTNILVYNNTQWIGWMSPDTKATRKVLYQELAMGGSTDWASDLENYNDVPTHADSWDDFKLSIKTGKDPYQVGPRSGNWTSVSCTDRAVEDIRHLTAGERWSMMDADDAWKDVVNVWKTYDRGKNGLGFTESVSNTIHGPEQADCGVLLDVSNCHQTAQCDGFDGAGSGAAGYEIWNSFVIIHEMYSSYSTALISAAAASINPALKDFETKFAPVPSPPDNKWLQILLDFVSLGATVAAGPFFNLYLAKMPYFLAKEGVADTLKDTTYAVIQTGLSVAKDLTGGGKAGTWTEEKQDEFSDYMGQVITAWGNVTEQALSNLFDGSDSSIATLTSLISDGKLIEGSVNGAEASPPGSQPDSQPPESDTALQASIAKALFAYAIPAIWSVSGVYPFIIDSGYTCGTIDPLGDYLSTNDMHATAGCYNGQLYYIASPKGDSSNCVATSCDGCTADCDDNLFSAPPGIDSLDGTSFGGIDVSTLITGSVRTYIQNGNQNGGGVTDPGDSGSFDSLYNQDVTTPGYIRMPVCSPDMAFKAWDQLGGPSLSDPNYPCIIAQSISDCGSSTFVDATSDASPTVADCMEIVKSIQGTQKEWEVENAISAQHQLLKSGTCQFGVQGEGRNGNIDFHVGAQDIVDVITQSIKMYGGTGKVGASGEMSCNGDVKGQKVQWGIY